MTEPHTHPYATLDPDDGRDTVTAGAIDDYPAAEPPVRHTADTITDNDLDLLYARVDYLAGYAATLETYAAEQRQRAEQVEDLLRIANATSNTSESERARAVQRAEKAERAANLLADSHRRAEQAEAAIARVCARHRLVNHRGRSICAECSAYDDQTTDNPPLRWWPCPTIAALDEPKEPRP